MVRYLLELSTATKISTGVYRWSFGTRNEHFPETVRVGPCTVSATTDIRHCVLTSETFRNEGKSHTLQVYCSRFCMFVILKKESLDQ